MSHPRRPAADQLTVYATTWCPFCSRLLGVLADQGVSAHVIDVDRDADAARFVESVNGGNRVVPTVVYPDGRVETNPEPHLAVLGARGAA